MLRIRETGIALGILCAALLGGVLGWRAQGALYGVVLGALAAAALASAIVVVALMPRGDDA